jgi:hypothetical protein
LGPIGAPVRTTDDMVEDGDAIRENYPTPIAARLT